MKKFLLIILILISSLTSLNTYAETIKVKVPLDMSKLWLTCSSEGKAFICDVDVWFWSVKNSIWKIIKYFTFISALSWVLYIIYNWIKLSMAWLNQEYEKEAKDSIRKTLLWLVILLLSWLILNFVAPWVYK